MVSILIEESVRIPGIADLAEFRRWACSADFPEHGWFSYLRGELYVDLSMEQAFTHNQVKAEYAEVLRPLIKRGNLGYWFVDRMLLSNLEVELSTEPDGIFVSFAALESGQVRLLEAAAGEGFVELVGTPDLVLEVVSKKSVHKDTVVLRELYREAGISEYWLVDARGPEPRFEVLRRGAKKYTAVRPRDGWLRSGVFDRSFRLTHAPDPLGHPQYTLHVEE